MYNFRAFDASNGLLRGLRLEQAMDCRSGAVQILLEGTGSSGASSKIWKHDYYET